MKDDKPDLLDWLGLRRQPDFSKARSLGGLISVTVIAGLLVLLIIAVIEFAKASWSDDPDGAALRSTGLVLAAMIGVPFLVWRSVVAQKQVDVAEQGQITDRINTAVQGLGAEKTVKRQRLRDSGKPAFVNVDGKPDLSRPIMEEVSKPNLEVRIGAIYALERIAQDSDRDHVQIMEILCAYIRQNAPSDLATPFPEIWQKAFEADWDDADVTPPRIEQIGDWAEGLDKPREDIQVALTVIGRRSARQIALESERAYGLDLRNTCLQGADLTKAHLTKVKLDKAQMQGADLSKAQIQGANLRRAQIQGVNLGEAQLRGAQLGEAQMQGAKLGGAQMPGAKLSAAQMQSADLGWAQMQEAHIDEAQMQKAKLNGAQLQRAKLEGAQMQGTILIGAQMQGADLGWAEMQSADLGGARMQGTDLRNAQMDRDTKLKNAVFRGAALESFNYSEVRISQAQADEVFYDGSVIFASGIQRAQGREEELGLKEFSTRWRAWQKEIGFDPDNPDG